jgi:hypothetical protein
MIVNAGWDDAEFTLPPDTGEGWQVARSSDTPLDPASDQPPPASPPLSRPGRSMLVLRSPIS